MTTSDQKNDVFSLVQKNKKAFDFSQEHGIHGTFIMEIFNPEFLYPNRRFLYSLGFKDEISILSAKETLHHKDQNILKDALDNIPSSDEEFSGFIRFMHSEGFPVKMAYNCLLIDEGKEEEPHLVVSLRKTFDFSRFERNPDKFIQRKNLLESVLDTVEVAIISCDADGELTVFNSAARKWHGLPARGIPQEEWAHYYSLFEPDGTTLFKTEDIPLVELLTHGTISKPEMYIKDTTAKARYVTCNGARLYDDEKNITGAVIAMHNITDRKEAEEKLRISEESFRGTFENAADGMCTADPTGRFITVNRSFCNMTGYSEKELLKTGFPDITHPEDKAGDVKEIMKLIHGDTNSFQREKCLIHKNGTIINVLVSISIVRSSDNTPLELIGQITNISLLKSTENKLQQTLAKLENLLSASTRVSIIGLDEKGLITTFNTGAENLLGYKKEEMLGKKSFADLHFEKETKEKARQLSQTYCMNVQPQEVFKFFAKKGISDTSEWTYQCKNKKKLPVQVTITPILNNEKITGYLCVGTDISDLKATEKELNAVLEVATDQNQRLLNFAHIVSHNLRSHSGNFEMLLEIFRDEQPDLKENEIFEMLFKASDNLKETIAHLNEVASINTSVEENIENQNLRSCVDQALSSISAIIQRAGLQVYNNIPEEFEVLALPAYLESIILNFSTNAIKYRSPERKPFLKFSANKTNEYIELSIEDNGIGIDLERHGHKLFGMYKTFHSHEDARGIGLFITKNQIEALGGKVEVQSEIGKGTVFTISLKYEKN